jgi:hypothetical protein
MAPPSSLLAELGIESGDRVYMRNPDDEVRSAVRWDLPSSCEFLEGNDLPHPPVDVALTWIDDDLDLEAHLDEVADRLPDDGLVWAVVPGPRELGGNRTTGLDGVLEAAEAADLEEDDVVHLDDGDMAVGLRRNGN